MTQFLAILAILSPAQLVLSALRIGPERRKQIADGERRFDEMFPPPRVIGVSDEIPF